MQKYVIIVAGGKGNRFKSTVPKQFIELGGLPILMHTITAFYQYQNDIKITVVLPKEQMAYWKKLCKKCKFLIKHFLIEGGEARFHSVRNGLSKIKIDGLVAIHDGVRPLVDNQVINECFSMAAKKGNAIPVVDLVDSVRQVDENGSNFWIDRSKLRLIQTPQVFESKLILKAFEQDYCSSFTDDASVLEALMPGSINLVYGNRQNIKITTTEDLNYAESILKSRERV